MIRHWLSTPPNGYLGSGYGSDVHSLLQQPISSLTADQVLDKLKKDVPLLGALPAGAVNMVAQQKPGSIDKVDLYITVFDEMIRIGEVDATKL